MSLFAAKSRQQQAAAGQPAQGPGAQLSQARERWGMTREQVASTLRLPNRVITALEQDHYEDLPPPAFVRGYISGYARLVGLDAPALIEACEMRGCCDPALAAKRSLSLRKGRGETLLRWTSYAVLAAFVGSAMLYWADKEEPATAQPIANLDHAPDQMKPAPSAGSDTGSHSTAANTAKASINSADGHAYGNIGATATDPTSTEAPADTTIATADAAAETAGNPIDTPAIEWPTLELEFSADSWLAVRDAQGNRLAWETVKAGSTRQLQGQPPLKVVLGNAEAVRISFQGTPFDPKPFTLGRMARFSVE